MTTLILACVGLLLFSGLFFLFPRRSTRSVEDDEARTNLEWYHLREAELSRDGDEGLTEDARLRLLEDTSTSELTSATPVPSSRHFPAWILLPLIALASGLLYYRLGAAPDVIIVEQLQTLDENAPPAQMAALIGAIEARASQRPDNLHYAALLGRYYMGQGDYGRAAALYRELAGQAPGDAQALAYAAQAEFLAAGRALSDDARLLAEQALAVDPHQRTALGLLGMASFEEGKYRAAIDYWERLLVMEQPGSDSANMIVSVIERARDSLGDEASPAVAAAAPQAVAADGGAGVTVSVSAPQGAEIAPGDTVFVLARNPDAGGRMPIAVQRLSAAQLPVTLRLDDANSMAGQKISEAQRVVVVVQVSPDGRPGAEAATWLGQAGPVVPDSGSTPLQITLSRNPG
ncbi:c-type cytochrome biogenesis protein CcmI [Halieaceae bacterium]|nr:c-type cytochrome biogenesis protein CcmI [Halieaceae bacterium]